MWALALPLHLLFYASCEKTEPVVEKAGESVKEAAGEVAEVIEKAVDPTPALSAEERAKMLGFASHLSADSDTFMAIYDGVGMVDGLRKLKIWEFIRETAKEEEGFDPEEAIGEGAGEVRPFLGEEFFLATGDGSAEQFDSMQKLQNRMSYYQFRILSNAFAKGAAEGDLEGAMSDIDDEAWLMEFAKDIGQYMPIVESVQVPPVMAGLKISDAEAMGMAEEQVRSFLAMAGDGAEPLEFEKAGAKFSGSLFKGEMLAEELEGGREEMDGMLGKENVDKIVAALKEKNLVLAAGKMGDYLLVYIGGSAEACPLADDLSGSLAASDAVSFIDGFGGKKVHGVFYGSEGLLKSSATAGLKPIAEGCRDGLKGVDGFGDTREIAALLDMVGEREAELLAMYDPASIGGVISVDEGVKFDIIGGGDQGAIDYGAKHQLAALGEGENVLLFADWVSDADYSEKAAGLVELLAETAYAVTGHLARLDVESDELMELKGGYQMFDGMFREDLLKLWAALSTMNNGLGEESAIVVDLNAEFPPIPNVPKGVVEEGRFIRASYVAPVKDRSKLKESWAAVDESVRAILATVKEMEGPELHMLKPTNSEKDDLVTWYFDAFAFSDDVKPSVTVSDEWFAASTSKTQALDLVGKAGADGPARQGSWMKLDLDVLRAYLDEAVKLVDKNGEEIIPDPDALAEFREQLPRVAKGLAAAEQFEAVTFHDRMENGSRRMTLHVKVR
ncbi:hypothetical protein HAHE_34570 [Haloferula helveola]|uniref:DUF3352 domain-containing protein n=1 Tax=Haloferula helveola TaxID=490095 RepID=A0ABN6H7N7_9BACT|nr:hypothetical protein HAHE_34570 [Haloferula helveola]